MAHRLQLLLPSTDAREAWMANRFLVWMLAVLAVALMLVPLLGMLGMIGAGWTTGGGMVMNGGPMRGMGSVGTVWTLLAIIVVAALVVLVLQQATKV
jgi:hypothetical protein